MQVKINKRRAYAPIRYEASRTYAGGIGKAFIDAAKKGEKRRGEFVGQELLPLLKAPVRRVGVERGPGPVHAEIVNVQVFGKYVDAGKVIFDLS